MNISQHLSPLLGNKTLTSVLRRSENTMSTPVPTGSSDRNEGTTLPSIFLSLLHESIFMPKDYEQKRLGHSARSAVTASAPRRPFDLATNGQWKKPSHMARRLSRFCSLSETSVMSLKTLQTDCTRKISLGKSCRRIISRNSGISKTFGAKKSSGAVPSFCGTRRRACVNAHPGTAQL